MITSHFLSSVIIVLTAYCLVHKIVFLTFPCIYWAFLMSLLLKPSAFHDYFFPCATIIFSFSQQNFWKAFLETHEYFSCWIIFIFLLLGSSRDVRDDFSLWKQSSLNLSHVCIFINPLWKQDWLQGAALVGCLAGVPGLWHSKCGPECCFWSSRRQKIMEKIKNISLALSKLPAESCDKYLISENH